jgi:hypothetical protein
LYCFGDFNTLVSLSLGTRNNVREEGPGKTILKRDAVSKWEEYNGNSFDFPLRLTSWHCQLSPQIFFQREVLDKRHRGGSQEDADNGRVGTFSKRVFEKENIMMVALIASVVCYLLTVLVKGILFIFLLPPGLISFSSSSD